MMNRAAVSRLARPARIGGTFGPRPAAHQHLQRTPDDGGGTTSRSASSVADRPLGAQSRYMLSSISGAGTESYGGSVYSDASVSRSDGSRYRGGLHRGAVEQVPYLELRLILPAKLSPSFRFEPFGSSDPATAETGSAEADLKCHVWGNLANWTIDPREAAVFDRGSTSAYLQGLSDFGWKGDERTVLFARAAVAALATTTILTTRISELCDHTPNYLGNGRWPQNAPTSTGSVWRPSWLAGHLVSTTPSI